MYIAVTLNNECVLFQNLTNLDQSRFVRRDRSGRGHVVLVCAEAAAQMGVAKPDFLRCIRVDQI